MEYKGFNLIAVIDSTQEELWEQLEVEVAMNQCWQVAEWMFDRAGHDPEFVEELPVYDEIVDEDGDYIITYTDCGMCMQVMLYEKVDEEEEEI